MTSAIRSYSRYQRSGSDHGAVRPVRHADPGRLGRRDHQGRDPDRRHLAQLRPVPQSRHERAVHGGEPQQAQHRAGPEASGRQGGAAPADRRPSTRWSATSARRPWRGWASATRPAERLNPRLVYAVATGFGQDGPWRARPAFDEIIQAASGFASAMGTDEEPAFVPSLIGDKICGMALASR